MTSRTCCFLKFPLECFKWLPPKKASTFKYFFKLKTYLQTFFFSSAINQCLGSLQSAARFGVTLSGDVAGKAAGPASRERNGLCWRAAKICIQKAITWVAL